MPRPPLLYLAHRVPYPPNKGDKVRSFNILRFLANHYRIFLATFADLEGDLEHEPELRRWCEALHIERIRPSAARVASLRGIARGEALTLPYYRNAALAQWVGEVVTQHRIERAVVFSGAMAQYLEGLPIRRRLIDFCDVDSAKWSQYAAARPWPLSWLYRREGELLGRFERDWAARAERASFVTAAERELFLQQSPQLAERVAVIENGVDADYFSPEQAGESPYARGRPTIVFSGAMDYWPNVDAACWFAAEVFPRVRERRPDVSFTIVGMNPAPEVQALHNGGAIRVTGTVPDVRPWVAHATAVVAPLRVARGIQNKVLEAMALARPVVVSQASAAVLRARAGEEYLAAGSAAEFAEALCRALDPRVGRGIGQAARERVLRDYSWDAHLAAFRELLEGGPEPAREASEACCA